MNIEDLFKVVRKQEALLWVGSGFSKYAGYPMGAELSELIYNELSTKDKKGIKKKSNLDEMSEYFYRTRNNKKNELTKLVIQHFDKPPTSLTYHKLLSEIPHFKTIITTNYDNCFELAYTEKLQKILHNKQIPYLDKRVELFKIHGDISDPDSIILTKTDYQNFFFKKEEIIWNTIRERISAKSIIFIGYNLEDPNINVEFKRVFQYLGEQIPNSFLVSPQLSQVRINSLRQQGIEFIKETGENFVTKLHKNINKNILTDYKSGWIDEGIMQKVATSKGLFPELKATKKGYQLSEIKVANNADLKFNISFDSINDKINVDSFKEFISGQRFGEISISVDKLKNFEFSSSGIDILNQSEIYQLIIKSVPRFETDVDVFYEDGTEFNNIKSEAFISEHLIQIKLFFKGTTIISTQKNKVVDIPSTEYKVEFPEVFSNIKDALEILNLVKKIASGDAPSVYIHKSKRTIKLERLHNETNSEMGEYASEFIEYFTVLKQVEQTFSTRFYDISSPTDEYFQKMKFLLSYANKKEHLINWNKRLAAVLELSTDVDEFKDLIENREQALFMEFPEEIVEIHGNKISLGTKVCVILDPILIDYKRTGNNGNNDYEIKIESKSKKLKIFYIMGGLKPVD